MNELGPDARAILEAARDGHDPDAATRARMRSELLRRVGAGAVVATTVAATAAKSGAAPITLLLAKVVAVAALATGGIVAVRHMKTPVVAPPPPAIVAVPAATASIAPPPPAMAVIDEPPPVVPTSKPVVVTQEKPKALPPSPPESTLAAELRTLREAHVALRDGRAGEALAIVEGLKGSALAPERAAARVLALCARGRADAQTSAEKFLALHSSSPLAPRVRAACAIP